jgi:hypothetical protein
MTGKHRKMNLNKKIVVKVKQNGVELVVEHCGVDRHAFVGTEMGLGGSIEDQRGLVVQVQ